MADCDTALFLVSADPLITSVEVEFLRERRVRGRQAKNLVRANIENLRWTMMQDLDAAVRAFAAELDEGLADAIRATHGAIAAAVEARRQHEEESQDLAAERERQIELVEQARERVQET